MRLLLRAGPNPVRQWLVLIGLLLATIPAFAMDTAVLEAKVQALVADIWETDLGDGVRLDEVDVRTHRATFTVHYADGNRLGNIVIQHPSRSGRRIGSLSVTMLGRVSQIRNAQQQRDVDILMKIIAHIQANDPGDFDQHFTKGGIDSWLRAGPLYGGLGLMAVVIILSIARRDRVKVVIRPNHLVPAAIQVTLYLYWMAYVLAVRERTVDIGAQLLFAYSFEAILHWSLGKTWRISAAPIPIVLSTNLFVWFGEPWLQCAAIAMALASKEWLVRDGKHIFNPSALAISILAAMTLLLPSWFVWGTPTPDVELNLSPNMAEILLILTVFAQLKFPIVLVPMTAVAGLELMRYLQFGPPGPYWPATFLILLLFATDPKTIPKTPLGRCFYGFLFGILIALFAHGIRLMDFPDTYAKVLPIPILNYFAPHFDRLAALLRQRVSALTVLDERYNTAHVGLWIIIAVIGISAAKGPSFQAQEHWHRQTATIVEVVPGELPRCEENPMWCEAFAFGIEARTLLR